MKAARHNRGPAWDFAGAIMKRNFVSLRVASVVICGSSLTSSASRGILTRKNDSGASCPNNLIEETLLRLFELRGIKREQLEAAVFGLRAI